MSDDNSECPSSAHQTGREPQSNSTATQAQKMLRWGVRIGAGFLVVLATTEPAQRIASLLNNVHPSLYPALLMGFFVIACYAVASRIAEQKDVEQWRLQAAKYHRARRRLKRLRRDHDSLMAKYKTESASNLEAQLRLQGVENCDGHWLRPVSATAPKFFPLRERPEHFQRKTRIVSFFNLKGGVGKSSLASSLGHILIEKYNKTVLFVDLDFQGTLSRLCVDNQALPKWERDEDTSDRLLTYLDEHIPDLPKLVSRLTKQYPHAEGQSGTIIARHLLARVEFRKEAQWLVESTPDRPKYTFDTRFLLRNALHSASIFNHYDYVFLDCPPRQTTASINALACSDHVLLPVQADQNAVEALPRTIPLLWALAPTFGCQSQIWVVANMTQTRAGKLIQRHEANYNRIKSILASLGGDIHLFDNTAAYDTKVAEASLGGEPGAMHSDAFEKVADEFVEKIGMS